MPAGIRVDFYYYPIIIFQPSVLVISMGSGKLSMTQVRVGVGIIGRRSRRKEGVEVKGKKIGPFNALIVYELGLASSRLSG